MVIGEICVLFGLLHLLLAFRYLRFLVAFIMIERISNRSTKGKLYE